MIHVSRLSQLFVIEGRFHGIEWDVRTDCFEIMSEIEVGFFRLLVIFNELELYYHIALQMVWILDCVVTVREKSVGVAPVNN